MNKAMEKFQSKHNWVKYCNEARERRVQKLIEEGCINPYAVVANGYKPKYITDLETKITDEGKVLIPRPIRKMMNLKKNQKFKITFEKDKICLTLKGE